MIWILYLVAALCPASIAAARVSGFVADVAAASVAEEASLDDASLVATFGVCEGAGDPHAIGDSGKAIGCTQLHEEHWRGHARAEVLADRVLQLRLWLMSLREARAACGSTSSGLGRLATGRCGGAPLLVARRMRGGC